MASLRTHNNRHRTIIEKDSFWTKSRWWRKRAQRRDKQFKRDWAAVADDFQVGKYVEDCRYHPCIVTEIEILDHNDVSINVQSCVNQTPSSCSWKHCGTVPLTEAEALERRDFILKYGILCHNIEYIYDERFAAEHIAGEFEQERDWGFAKNQSVEFITDAGRTWIAKRFGVDVRSLEIAPAS